MNKRTSSVGFALLFLLSVALVNAENNDKGNQGADVAVKNAEKKVPVTQQASDRDIPTKDTEPANPYSDKRPKLIAVQDQKQLKEPDKRSPASDETLNIISDLMEADPSVKPQPKGQTLSLPQPIEGNEKSKAKPAVKPAAEAHATIKSGGTGNAVSAAKVVPSRAPSKVKPDKNVKQSPIATKQPVLPVVDEKKVSRKEKREEAKAEKCLQAAMRSYHRGEMDAAEDNITRCLMFDPDNQAALDLKRNIANIRERSEEIRNDLSEQCYYRGESCYRDGNILDAMLLVQKSITLNPRMDKAQILFRTLSESNQEIIKTLKGNDKARFSEAIKYFLHEDFSMAAGILRNLQPYYPQLSTMLAVAEVHSSDDASIRRSREYYASALDNIANERYLKAQEELYLALEMDKNNLDAKLKLLQVNQELGSQRTGAVGQE